MKKSDEQEPRVGIFWLVQDRLIIDSTPLWAEQSNVRGLRLRDASPVRG
jgi:hypothetical protein